MRNMLLTCGLILAYGVPAVAGAVDLTVTPRADGTVTQSDGLAAWDRLHAVFSHPRCSNCHVDEAAVPLWTETAISPKRIHGMHITGGESRIGAETLPCGTCHITSDRPNLIPDAPPHTGMDWQLAPVEFLWVGKTSAEICAQVRDPDRNGDRDGAALIEHITHDADVGGFIAWGFDPGPGREAAPGDMQSHLDDTIQWIAAGMPCETDNEDQP